jgi:formylglycine-generating enzyme required for sulfatase activity
VPDQPDRRIALRQLYGGVVENCEEPPEAPSTALAKVEPLMPPDEPKRRVDAPKLAGWPFDRATAERLQVADGADRTMRVDLGQDLAIEFVRIPAGRFVMGDPDGGTDERPASIVEIAKPFWMSRCEVRNEVYARFDPTHDSRFEHRSSWIFDESYLGWPLNQPRQPVVRVSWNRAMAFCAWLSQRTGLRVTLPTEAQWEYACRAGTATPFHFGDGDTDFSAHANLADRSMSLLALEGWRPKSPDLAPRDARWDDGALVTRTVGAYAANAWGLHDLHGNAAEWTRSDYRSYPWRAESPDDVVSTVAEKVVRGGSWRDRPKRARSAFRLHYPAYQRVFNVGFRVVIESKRGG